MTTKVLVKNSIECTSANMPDYEQETARFSWQAARKRLTGLPNGSLNIAFEAIDRHLLNGNADKIAICWLARDGGRRTYSYRDLAAASNRFANVLESLGVKRGERVFSLLGRVPDLYSSVIGTLKVGSVYCPLFSAFGPEPVRSRLEIGDARVLVTSTTLYQRKVASIRKSLPGLSAILLVDEDAESDEDAGIYALHELMQIASDAYCITETAPDAPALLHFTSGTTGTPKGALHVHEAVLAHHETGRMVLDLKPDDVYWCTVC
ncbi:MAG: AMP-binding protein [Granulosicoccus sp.]